MEKGKSELRRRVERFFVGLLTRIAVRLVRRWPIARIQRLGDLFGWLLFVAVPSRQRLADLRLRQVFGDRLTAAERSRIRCFCTRNLAKTMLELLRLPTMTDEEFDQFVTVEGIEHLDQAMAQGRGVIALSAHYGNWELLPRVMRRRGYPVSVVARTASDPVSASIIIRSRESIGQHNIDRNDVRSMMRALAAGHILGLMPDQYAVEGGVIVDFLGMPASTSPGPAVLALRTGAPIVPMFARRTEDNRIICEFHPPLQLKPSGDRRADIVAATQLINDIIGREILKRPGQWLWLHRRWRPQDFAAASRDRHGAEAHV